MTPDRQHKEEQAHYQRERIATAAMAAIVGRRIENDRYTETTAKLAVDYADALIKELNNG